MKSFPDTIIIGCMLLLTGCGFNAPQATEKRKEPKISQEVILKNELESSKEVQVTNDPKKWMRENEIAYVTNGTPATIQAIHDETIEAGDTKVRVLRYKVLTKTNPKVEGWVFASNAGYKPLQPK
jgi:hypothetical protein